MNPGMKIVRKITPALALLGLVLAFIGCKNLFSYGRDNPDPVRRSERRDTAQDSRPHAKPQPKPRAHPAADEEPGSADADKTMPPEEFFDRFVQQLELGRDFLREAINIYRSYGRATPEADQEVSDLEAEYKRKATEFQDIQDFDGDPGNAPEFAGYEVDGDESEAYLQANPEVKEHIKSLFREIQDLEDQLQEAKRPSPQ